RLARGTASFKSWMRFDASGYVGKSSHVAARMGKALSQAGLYRVATADKYDRDSVGRLGDGECLRWTNREDHVHTVFDKFSSNLRKALLPAFTIARHNEEVLAFDVAQLAEPLPECREMVWAGGWEAGLKVSNFGDPRRLLRRAPRAATRPSRLRAA